jgi:ABC-type glycerol-3-phosphate transport system permease component
MASQVSATTPSNASVSAGDSVAARQPKKPWLPAGHLAIYIVLAIGAIAALVPFLYTVSVSLMTLSEATSGKLLPSNPQWSNYSLAWYQAR